MVYPKFDNVQSRFSPHWVKVESMFSQGLSQLWLISTQVMLFYFTKKVGMLDLEQFGGVKMEQNKISQIDLIELEVNRLYKIYQKDYLECEDIMKITGVGKNNIRTLMNNPNFPTKKVSRRKVVSLTSFVVWQFNNK